MGNLLPTVIPAVLAFVVAYQGGLTRTSRLRSIIRANLELLDKLPGDHPSRAKLATHIEELADLLVLRQHRRYKPTTLGPWFGVNVTLLVIMAMAIVGSLLGVSGVWESASEPSTPEELWQTAIMALIFAVFFAGFAVRSWRQRKREQPQP
jgi:hypothetical protein